MVHLPRKRSRRLPLGLRENSPTPPPAALRYPLPQPPALASEQDSNVGGCCVRKAALPQFSYGGSKRNWLIRQTGRARYLAFWTICKLQAKSLLAESGS